MAVPTPSAWDRQAPNGELSDFMERSRLLGYNRVENCRQADLLDRERRGVDPREVGRFVLTAGAVVALVLPVSALPGARLERLTSPVLTSSHAALTVNGLRGPAFPRASRGFANAEASAVGDCVFDPDTATVTIHIARNKPLWLIVNGTGLDWGLPSDHAPCGLATVYNTDTVEVYGTTTSKEFFAVDQSTARLSPGATPEASGVSEIEVHAHLGGNNDQLNVLMGAEEDAMSAGDAGLAWNGDDDADITYEGNVQIDLEGQDGNDLITGEGGHGTGGPSPETLNLNGQGGNDTIIGSPTSDRNLDGGYGDDRVYGKQGTDRIGVCGNDVAYGGRGSDSFYTTCSGLPTVHTNLYGQRGNDLFFVRNGWKDDLDGGEGTDSAQVDEGLDTTVSVETFLP
jgi:hypothetical protein